MNEQTTDHTGDHKGRSDPQPTPADTESSGFVPCPATVSDQKMAPATEDRPNWFSTTHWSVVLAARQNSSPEAESALECLCRTYWYPLYSFVRRQGHTPHDAQDLTQGFFAEFLQKNYLASVAPEKGRFRSFLLAALNHFLSHERDRVKAQKRGRGERLISLDETTAEGRYLMEPRTDASPESMFDRRWAITLLERSFALVREEFRRAGKQELFDRLKPFLSDEAIAGDYAALSPELSMTPNAVAVAVHRLRQRYREAVRLEVAHTVASPDEIDDELRYLRTALAET